MDKGTSRFENLDRMLRSESDLNSFLKGNVDTESPAEIKKATDTFILKSSEPMKELKKNLGFINYNSELNSKMYETFENSIALLKEYFQLNTKLKGYSGWNYWQETVYDNEKIVDNAMTTSEYLVKSTELLENVIAKDLIRDVYEVYDKKIAEQKEDDIINYIEKKKEFFAYFKGSFKRLHDIFYKIMQDSETLEYIALNKPDKIDLVKGWKKRVCAFKNKSKEYISSYDPQKTGESKESQKPVIEEIPKTVVTTVSGPDYIG